MTDISADVMERAQAVRRAVLHQFAIGHPMDHIDATLACALMAEREAVTPPTNHFVGAGEKVQSLAETEALTQKSHPDFVAELQGFAAMCDRSLSVEDGSMLAVKFREAAFVVSMAAKELERLRSMERTSSGRNEAVRAVVEALCRAEPFVHAHYSARIALPMRAQQDHDKIRAALATAREARLPGTEDMR